MNEDGAAFIAPITLILGGGLLTFGALSLFFGTGLFKTKLRATAGIAAGLAFLVATEALFVTSGQSGRFFSGQKLDVTDCELEGETALPQERHKPSVVLHDYIVGCMEKLGYEWTTEHDHCKEAPLATNPFCYLPTRAFPRAIVRVQAKFE